MKTSLLIILLALVTPAQAELTQQRLQELKHLLKHDCGSCHGMTLNGGLGPALLPGSLKDKPDELLFVTIREGRHGTPMPPWKSLLSDDDIKSIIKLLRTPPE
ncbi:MAG: c-type cytochrome [Gammaproteobacteria bacterium]|nr:c-type cytochrome [Gammaproteobacteria bacterium]